MDKSKIPAVFREKMDVDSRIDEVKIHKGNVTSISDVKAYIELKKEQAQIRIGCENFIKQQRERGNSA